MRKAKYLLVIGALGVLLILSTGCQQLFGSTRSEESRKTEITFEWWGSEVRHDKYLKVISLFEEQNPEINVIPHYDSWDDYWRNMSTKAASGELPDIFQTGDIYLAQYAEKQLLMDLSASSLNDVLNTEDISKDILATGKVNNQQVGIPGATNAMALLVNEKLIEQAGLEVDYGNLTYQEFVDLVIAVHQKTGVYGLMDVGDNYVLMQYYLRSKGEDLSKVANDSRHHVGYTKANFVAFMLGIQKMAQAGALTPPEIMANLKSFNDSPFAQDQAAFVQTWANQLVTYQESAGNDQSFEIKTPYGAKDGGIFFRPAILYSLAKSSQEPKAAAKFLDFLLNNQEANLILGIERGIPSNEKVSQAIYPSLIKQDQAVVAYQETVKDIVGSPGIAPPIGASELTEYFKVLYSQVYHEEITPEQSYQLFYNACEKVFAREYEGN